MGAEFLFMDDNARPHRANIVDKCLQSEDITPTATQMRVSASDGIKLVEIEPMTCQVIRLPFELGIATMCV
ncbi:hypothetical protein TNCV_3813041 [Trichonephila clavipes]|nr:hypothetical protein TNCV_3813041 [Trichonephila clavipes]